MKKETTILSNEKFQDIYKNELFRNAVAFAHGCKDSSGNHKYYIALVYPNEYIVTAEQIQLAKSEYERAKTEKVKNIPIGTLVFVGMGMNYTERYEGDLCNHRIRTEFLNSEGRRFFIEVGTGKGNNMCCDFSIDRDLQEEYEKKLSEAIVSRNEYRGTGKWNAANEEVKKYLKQPYYNYGNIQNNPNLGLYDKNNLLKIVNETFGCNYTSIEVDNYTLRTEDFICKCNTNI